MQLTGHRVVSFDDKSLQYFVQRGCAVAQFIEALRYKSEGRGFDSRWDLWIFH